jgi:hypothetical protein
VIDLVAFLDNCNSVSAITELTGEPRPNGQGQRCAEARHSEEGAAGMGVFLRSTTARARKLPCQGFETGFSEPDAVGFFALATYDADCALAAYGEETFID